LTLLSTIHARDAVGAVTALRNNGAKDWEIGASLEMCISQRLVRRLCLHCRKTDALTEIERQWFSSAGASVPEQLWQPKGCDACGGTGFDGRIGIFELWRLDGEARRLIRHGADGVELSHHALEQGTQPLLKDAITKVVAGLIPLSEIRHFGVMGNQPG
jgi:type II secretory ATPase GspE/PulE/Tfp pilus assembly ATPase PilB-like protein